MTAAPHPPAAPRPVPSPSPAPRPASAPRQSPSPSPSPAPRPAPGPRPVPSPSPSPAPQHAANAAGPAVLAIDGGNSKTDVALVAADGTLLAAVRGPGSNPQVIGAEQAMALLSGLVATAARQAGLVRAEGSPVAAHTSACLAGADLPEQEQQLTELVQAQGWSVTSSVVNDTFAVLRAGLDDAAEPWGVAVTCGAGINCVGMTPDGRTTRFLALGRLSGDWGGGADLGAEVLWWAIRAEDGRGRQTLLRKAVAGHFGVAGVSEVATGIQLGTLTENDLLGLAPVLLEVAGRGDSVARDLVQRLAEEVCLMARTAARSLGLAGTGGGLPVVLGGGLLTARDPLLTESIAATLAAELPGAVMRIVDVPPVVGAALLGLDQAGAPASAERALRAAYLAADAGHRDSAGVHRPAVSQADPPVR